MYYLDNLKKTRFVVLITAITMLVEIFFGYLTGSMALLADGYHMLTHVGALSLSWLAYHFYEKHKDNPAFRQGPKKILALSGFTSALMLQAIAVVMVVESTQRILYPLEILFFEAIIVAIIGLIVNIISAFALNHDKEHSDHNIKAAYLHVITDAFTSVFAIIALVLGMKYKLIWLDPLAGVAGAIVISVWSISLVITTAKELLDYKK